MDTESAVAIGLSVVHTMVERKKLQSGRPEKNPLTEKWKEMKN